MSKWHYQTRLANANICLSLDESAVKQSISSFVGHLIYRKLVDEQNDCEPLAVRFAIGSSDLLSSGWA
jgi:hypothetical protein